jgi:pimeloyl-ACP methyl ester carboxylesterase
VGIFVILHGGWGGGWEWAEVARFVRAAGHDAYTPTLTGMGERSHLGHPDVDLQTYIQDIVNVITYEDLHDVVLTGQSYSGIVITGVANAIPNRLRHVIYVDAFVPEHGQSVFDLLSPGWIDAFKAGAAERGDGWRVPPPPFVDDPPVGPWAKGRYGDQPIKTLSQPVQFSNPLALRLRRTFISCTDKPDGDLFEPFARRARESDQWGYREIPTVHDAHATMPREMAELFLEIAG